MWVIESFTGAIPSDRHRRAIFQRLMRALEIIELDPSGNSGFSLVAKQSSAMRRADLPDSWLRNLARRSIVRSWRGASRPQVREPPSLPGQRPRRTPEPLDPEVASSTHKSGSHVLASVAPDLVTIDCSRSPPRRSLRSVPHRFAVSSSSWSAPFIKTERHPHHLSRWSTIRGSVQLMLHARVTDIDGQHLALGDPSGAGIGRSKPKILVSDNDRGFTSNAILTPAGASHRITSAGQARVERLHQTL